MVECQNSADSSAQNTQILSAQFVCPSPKMGYLWLKKVFIGHLYSGPTNIQAHYYLWSCITIYVIQKEMLKP